MKKLLEKEPSKRLGSVAGAEETVLSHPWFSSLDQEALKSKSLEIDPKLIPELKQDEDYDLKYFEDVYLSQKVRESLIGKSARILIRDNQDKFADFDK